MSKHEPDPARRPLPMADDTRPERADAARNRRTLLAAADAILAEHGPGGLTMEAVGTRAGMGAGTVYRRFGDLGGLAHAMLDAQERALQAGFLSGPPPLGPGAPPVRRIHAFAAAFVDRLEAQADLLAIAETDTVEARYRSGAYGAHHAHLAALIAAARPGSDAGYLADALLSPLEAALYLHQRRVRAMDPDRIRAGLRDVVDRITAPETGTDRPRRTTASGTGESGAG